MLRLETVFGIAIVALGVLLSATGRAQDAAGGDSPPAKTACIESFEKAQDDRNEGRLLEARGELTVCAHTTCSEALRSRCVTWLAEVDSAIPDIVISVTDRDGQELTSATVFVDDEAKADRLDGKAIRLDPGIRVVRVETEAGATLEQEIVAKQGEKNRIVRFEIGDDAVPAPVPPADAPAGSPEPSQPDPEPVTEGEESGGGMMIAGGVVLGIGALGVGIGTVSGLIALSESSEFESECPDNTCAPGLESDLDSASTVANVSTVTLIAGGALAAVGTTLLVVGAADSPSDGSLALRMHVGFGNAALEGTF